MSQAIALAADFIARWEGCELHEYLDIAGLPTIGVGHLIKDGEDFSDGVTEAEALAILESDLSEAVDCVEHFVDVDLTMEQKAALISFVFNVGCGAFRGSTLLSRLNVGRFDDASQQFGRWNKAGGKVVQGLTNRRAAEAKLFRGES